MDLNSPYSDIALQNEHTNFAPQEHLHDSDINQEYSFEDENLYEDEIEVSNEYEKFNQLQEGEYCLSCGSKELSHQELFNENYDYDPVLEGEYLSSEMKRVSTEVGNYPENLEEQFLSNLRSLFNKWKSGTSNITTAATNVAASAAAIAGVSGSIVNLMHKAINVKKGTTRSGTPYFNISRIPNRSLDKVVGIVLHQMAFNRDNNFDSYLKVGAHYIILRDGSIGQLYDNNVNLNASNGFNSTTVAVEFAGNFPNVNGKWWYHSKWSSSTKRRNENKPTQAQIQAGRFLLRQLINDPSLPNFKHVFAHRQSSATRTNDPGPDIWCHIGDWAIKNLGYTDASNDTKGRGKKIDPKWKSWC